MAHRELSETAHPWGGNFSATGAAAVQWRAAFFTEKGRYPLKGNMPSDPSLGS